jgi:glycosyltransferase involved in cell wall biosynthesis
VSVIEALAGGRPVVATRVGGVPDVVRDSVDGYLVEPGDVDALAERLGRLAADPELARRMGEAGRARVLERYSVERLVGDVDALYRKLLAERGLDDGRA